MENEGQGRAGRGNARDYLRTALSPLHAFYGILQGLVTSVKPKVLVSTPNLVVAMLGDVLHISCFRGTLTMADVLASGNVIDEYRAKLGKPLPELVVIEPSVGIPEEAVRQRLARRMKNREPLTLGTAMVFEATGFFAATVRSLLTALQLASRRKTPMRIYATLPEATQFLIRSGWLQLAPEAIIQAVAAIRTSGTGIR